MVAFISRISFIYKNLLKTIVIYSNLSHPRPIRPSRLRSRLRSKHKLISTAWSAP